MSNAEFHIRAMTPEDIPLGMRLKTQAGWNQLEADWRRFLVLAPDSSFVGEWGGHPIATTIVFDFSGTAWLAVVLVDAQFRNRGIGSQMIAHALRWAEHQGILVMRLDATALGKPVYEKQGFQTLFEITRYQGSPNLRQEQPSGIQEAATSETLAVLDQQCLGVARAKLHAALFRGPGTMSYLLPNQGYAIVRPGANAFQVGPVVANNPEAGIALLRHAAYHCAGKNTYIDIPRQNLSARRFVESIGLAPQRVLYRMQRGESTLGPVEPVFASSGPEKG